MMPVVSGKYATGDTDVANAKISETIRLTMFICIPAAVGLAVLSFPIMGVLFPESTDLGVKLLLFGSVSVVFSALSTITNSVLQSIGKQRIALRNAAISLGLNLITLALMLLVAPVLGIYAILIANILFAVCMCVLNGLALRQYLGYKNEFRDAYGKPLMAAAGMGAAAWLIYYGVFALTKRPFIGLLVAIPAAALIYMVLFVMITGTTETEMRRFPMGTKIVRFLRLIRVYR